MRIPEAPAWAQTLGRGETFVKQRFGAANRRLPDVIGIGAEKCGTTSLHYYLKAHPEIGVQRSKEMRFFVDGAGGRWHRGLDWYVRQFPGDRRTLVESHGGGYSAYPFRQGVPARIHATIPQARFLYVVRDPIERLISRWVHNYANGDEHRPLDEALADLDDIEYVPQSRYAFQLEQYLGLFAPSRFLIVDQRDLLSRRHETLRAIFRFLAVREDFSSPQFEVIRHPSRIKRRLNPLGAALDKVVGRRLLDRLGNSGRHWFKRLVYTPVSTRIERPQLDRALRARLREVFRPDVRRLEEIAGRRFDGWLA